MYAYMRLKYGHTHVLHVCRGEPAAIANLYLHPRISTRSRNLTAPLIFGIQVAYVAPAQDSGSRYVDRDPA